MKLGRIRFLILLALVGLAPALPASAQAPKPALAPKPAPKPAPASPPAPAPEPPPPATPPAPAPLAPLDAYAEAAATTILAEQNCPGTRLHAGRLTSLRLAARVGPAQEATLEQKLRSRAAEMRQRIAADGREAWCAAAFDSFGPRGTIAKGVLMR